LPQLKFAADVTAPSAKRYYRWNGTNAVLDPTGNSALTTSDTPSWKMLVQTKAQMVSSYIRPIRTAEGIEVYNVFMSPQGIARLKQDSDFIQAWRYARERGEGNPIFKGTPLGGKDGIRIDGLNILEYRHVFTTLGAASGSKWGSGNTVDGQRVLFCGAQALALADIGSQEAIWDEKYFDFGNSQGIAFGRIFGMLKPKFYSIYAQSTEDHGVLCVDTAL
jgi:N4-gp56 family major capsid protein